jgi:hypothetical protein
MSTMTDRPWWQRTFRLVMVWVLLMLVCAHLALVMAGEVPVERAVPVDGQRVNTMNAPTFFRPLELSNSEDCERYKRGREIAATPGLFA